MDWNDDRGGGGGRDGWDGRDDEARGDGGRGRPRIPDRLMRLLTAEPFMPIRVFAGGWVWELRFREAMVVVSSDPVLRGVARRDGHDAWVDLEIRASQIIAIEVDSRLFRAEDRFGSEETS
jgi:hypothetical protein